jgi:hypothetical protein
VKLAKALLELMAAGVSEVNSGTGEAQGEEKEVRENSEICENYPMHFLTLSFQQAIEARIFYMRLL